MQTKDIPALIMLIGGAVAFIICFFTGASFMKLLIVLLISLFIFFIIGSVVRFLVEKHLENVLFPKEEEDEEEGEEVEEGELSGEDSDDLIGGGADLESDMLMSASDETEEYE